MTNRFMPGVLLAAALTLPVLANGCSDNPADALCCKDFQVGVDLSGADLGADAEFKGQFVAFGQAVGDLSATATAMLNDVTTACQQMAVELGAKADDPSVNGKTGVDAAKAWCNLAVGQINASVTATGAGSLTIEAEGPKCSASFEAKTNCEAKCDVNAKCDLQANPPKCTGGELSVKCDGSCSGSCQGSASASVSCSGQCDATCEGDCTGSAGASVDCEGQCQGNCTGDCTVNGSTQSGTSGKCAGTCKGKCDATCTFKAGATVKCNATCKGKCTGSCQSDASANIKCEGSCKGSCTGTATAPKCEGGKLEGGCTANADCSANCSASASARAECTPPRVVVKASGTINATAQAQFDVLIHSLELHLPQLIVALKGRGTAFVDSVKVVADGSVKVVGNTGHLNAKGVACAGAMASAIGAAVTNAQGSLDASASVYGAVGGK